MTLHRSKCDLILWLSYRMYLVHTTLLLGFIFIFVLTKVTNRCVGVKVDVRFDR